MSLKEKIETIFIGGIALLGIGLGFGLGVGLNYSINNYTIKTPDYVIVSKAKFPVGSSEYTKFSDGREEIRTNNVAKFRRYIYDNNNKKVEVRIMQWYLYGNNTKKILESDKDYSKNKEEFDKANKTLEEMRQINLERINNK